MLDFFHILQNAYIQVKLLVWSHFLNLKIKLEKHEWLVCMIWFHNQIVKDMG